MKMKQIFSLLVFALSLCNLAGLAGAQTNKQVEEEIVKLEKQRITANYQGDIDTMNRLHADDYLLFNGTTTTAPATKATQIAGVKARSEAVKQERTTRVRILEQPQVRIYGNVAVINGLNVETRPDKTLVRKSFYTGIWVKRAGRWQIVNAQHTELPVK